MNKKLQGVFCPLTTPFNKNGTLNLEHLEENIKKYVVAGVNGYLILGSNGENKSLRTEEKISVIKTVIKHKKPDQIAMVASIFESTIETIEFAKASEELGADFITLLPPSYFRKLMTDEVLIKYFTDVASAVKIPCMLYHAPQFSGTLTLSMKVMEECANHENIVGIKDSSGNIQRLLINMDREDFTILSGSANTFMDSLMMGASGGVISLANSVPSIVKRLYQLVTAKKIEEAILLNKKILKANQIISGKYGVAGVKAAMDICGYNGGNPRLPLLPLNEADYSIITNTLDMLRN